MKKYVKPEMTSVELRAEEGIAVIAGCYLASCPEGIWEEPTGS
jgi:hypothetical protein